MRIDDGGFVHGRLTPPHAAAGETTKARGPLAEAPGARFSDVLRGLGGEIDRGERLVKNALAAGGGSLGPADLLALQAGVYRYSEAVDLAAKLVERASSGVKTVLQGQ